MTRKNDRRGKRTIVGSLLMAGAALVMLPTAGLTQEWNGEGGHVLISDQFNNRVIEVDQATHKIVWSFGNGSDVAGPHSVVGVNDAERFG